MFGTVQFLVLSGAAPDALSGRWEDFAAALAGHRETVRRRVAEYCVQTNEVRRSTSLLPAFLTAAAETALPLELLELGPSAGLNLILDRYRYRYANGVWGRPEARLELSVEERPGCVPPELLTVELEIRRRRGIDLAPVDATSPEGYLLLRSYVWPGRDDRVARLDAAVETLRELPARPELLRGDYVRLLPEILRSRPDDALTLVFDTFSTPYLGAEAAGELRGALEQAGADGRPLAWVGVRPWDPSRDEAFELELRVWPGPVRPAARVDPHGDWLDWRL